MIASDRQVVLDQLALAFHAADAALGMADSAGFDSADIEAAVVALSIAMRDLPRLPCLPGR